MTTLSLGILNAGSRKLISKRFNSYWKLAHYYTILKTRPTAKPEQIKESFLTLSKIYHPDNLETGDQAKFVRLKEAYDKIKDAPLQNPKFEPGADEDLSHAGMIRRTRLSPSQWTDRKGSATVINKKLYR